MSLPHDQWTRIEAMFHQAVELPPPQRADLLASLLREEPHLHGTLDSLLRADQASSGFEAVTARGPHEQDSAEDPLARRGVRIGPFELDELLGTGGMGTVWLAHRADEQFEQRVAIKLIKRGMDTDEVLRRFRRERQVLARFEHPNIARLLDGGATPDGRPYLVMEYIVGETITDFCQRRALSIRQRLKLFLQACGAVHYAHQNLVVHRDLKPTNLLVAADGTPKLLDFGIAKILRPQDEEAPASTSTELRLLTPRYASPEQVKSEPVSTATDVYSLGVILFELLTGSEPYQLTTRSRAEYERAICEQEPLRPSEILTRRAGGDRSARSGMDLSAAHVDWHPSCRLAGDLDSIVLKALRKRLEERYSSVQQFAEDIERFLSGRPIRARPQTPLYKAAKFIGRNKVAVLAAALVTITLIGGALASMTFAIREARQRALAELRLREAREQAAIAEAINRFLNEDLLASVDPDVASDPNITVRSVLDTAAQKIGTRFFGQPLIEASILTTVGATYQSLGEYAVAEPHLARALQLLSQTPGERSEAVIAAMTRLGSIRRMRANYSAAEPLIAEAAELAGRKLGDLHPVALSAALERGELYVDTGRTAEAIETLEQTLKRSREALGAQSEQTLKTAATLAVAYAQDGRNEDAERLDLDIVQQRTQLLGDDGYGTITALNNLAFVRMNLGKYEEAESLFRTVVERSRRVLGDQHPSTLTSIDNLGLIATYRGRADEAAQLHLEAFNARQQKYGPEHPDTLHSQANLGFSYLNSGRYDQAERIYKDLLARMQKTSGPDHPGTLTMENNLAYCAMELGRIEEAEQRFTEIVERRERALGRNHPETIGSMSNLAKARIDLKRFQEAADLLDDAFTRAGESLPPEHAIVGMLCFRKGLSLVGLKQFGSAEELLSKARRILTDALGPDHPRVSAVARALEQLPHQRDSLAGQAKSP